MRGALGRRWQERLFVVGAYLQCAVGVQAGTGLVGRDRWNWGELVFRLGWFAALGLFQAWFLRAAEEHDWFTSRPDALDRARVRRRVRTALTEGLPADPDPAAWERALSGIAKELRAARAVGVGTTVLVLGAVAGAAVVANDGAWTVWAVTLPVAAMGVVVLRFVNRRLTAVRELRSRLPVG